MIGRCKLVRRGCMYDVYIDGKKYGSGQWGYITTAYYVYIEQGLHVEVIDEV